MSPAGLGVPEANREQRPSPRPAEEQRAGTRTDATRKFTVRDGLFIGSSFPEDLPKKSVEVKDVPGIVGQDSNSEGGLTAQEGASVPRQEVDEEVERKGFRIGAVERQVIDGLFNALGFIARTKAFGLEVELMPEAGWQAGRAHPKFPHVVSGTNLNSWVTAPGYRWEDAKKKDFRARWVAGINHRSLKHLVSADSEGVWLPAPGWVWKQPKAPEDGVKWRPGLPHRDWQNVVASDEADNFVAAPGYRWAEGAKSGDFRVVWEPGQAHPSIGRVISAAKEGVWLPMPGWIWKSVEKPEKGVKWQPGLPHRDWENVVASGNEGRFLPDQGHQWRDLAKMRAGQFIVEPIPANDRKREWYQPKVLDRLADGVRNWGRGFDKNVAQRLAGEVRLKGEQLDDKFTQPVGNALGDGLRSSMDAAGRGLQLAVEGGRSVAGRIYGVVKLPLEFSARVSRGEWTEAVEEFGYAVDVTDPKAELRHFFQIGGPDAEFFFDPWFLADMVFVKQGISTTVVHPDEPPAYRGPPVLYINGVGTSKRKAIRTSRKIANKLSCVVTLYHLESAGSIPDVLRAGFAKIASKYGLPTNEVAFAVVKMIEKNRKVNLIGHSAGALAIYSGIKAKGGSDLGKLCIITMGAPIPHGSWRHAGVGKWRNLIYRDDPVPRIEIGGPGGTVTAPGIENLGDHDVDHYIKHLLKQSYLW